MAKKENEPKPRLGRGFGGGPKTQAGKDNSKKNATKHGLCSSRNMLLPEEDPAEFAELERGWREEYQPEGHAENALVRELVWAEWKLTRSKRRVNGAEQQAEADWTEETNKHLELMHRYLTAAERSFYRALNAVQALRKDRLKMWDREQKFNEKFQKLERELIELKKREPEALGFDVTKKNPYGPFGPAAAHSKNAAKTPAQQLFQGQLSKKKQQKAKKVATLEQWVEISVEDGKTVTKLYPSNEELIKKGQAMWPAPDLVYRRLSFANGVPEEYAWTTGEALTRERGGMGIQRMSTDTWLEVIEREEATATGHVGPTGVGNLPRPMSRGGCDCEVCAGNRGVLAKMGVVV